MAINHTREYQKFVSSEKRISRNAILPRRLYRITLYKTVHNEIQKLQGVEQALLFVSGVDGDLVHGLKLNDIRPNVFFKWLDKITINNKKIDEIKTLDDIVRRSDKKGKQLFERYIKPSTFYKTNIETYRTYKLNGIRYIKEVNLKNEVYLKYFQSYKIEGFVDKPKHI